MKKTCILVIGMHRSGTSAITGMLSTMGVYLGSFLMKENENNEKGYFENNYFYILNDKLLNQIDSCWDDMFFDEGKASSILDVRELKELLIKEFKDNNIFAIKDPRISFLLPIYKQALEELGIALKIIIPYRNPMEVIRSLNVRNNFSCEKGILLWLYHFLLAEKHSRNFERVFIDFDELMSNSSNVITLISNKLNIALKSKYNENKEAIDDFLVPELKHHNFSTDDLSGCSYKLARKILLLKDDFYEDSVFSKFDEIRKEIFSYQKLFYNKDILQINTDMKTLKQYLTELKAKYQNTAEELAQSKEKFSKLRKNHQNTAEELAQSKEKFSKLRKNHQNTAEELAQSKEKFSKLRKNHQNTAEELAQSKEKFSKLRKNHQNTAEELAQSKEKFSELRKEHQNTAEELTQSNEKSMYIKNKEIKSLEDELLAIHTSKFWKITKVFRKYK